MAEATAEKTELAQFNTTYVEVVKEVKHDKFGKASIKFLVPQHENLQDQVAYYHGEDALRDRLNSITGRLALSPAVIKKIEESSAETPESWKEEVKQTIERTKNYRPRAGGLSVAKAGKNAKALLEMAESEDPEQRERFQSMSKEDLIAQLQSMLPN